MVRTFHLLSLSIFLLDIRMLFLVLELHVLLMRWTGPMALFNQHRAAQGDLQWLIIIDWSITLCDVTPESRIDVWMPPENYGEYGRDDNFLVIIYLLFVYKNNNNIKKNMINNGEIE
jgi:hypothetical protein